MFKLSKIDRHAPLAQLDRASGYGPEGQGFESLKACQKGPSHRDGPFWHIIREKRVFEPLTLSERQANRRRRIPDNLRPDFAAFSCNTQSIAAKKRHHQNTNDLGIHSCRLAVVHLKRGAFFERSG